MKCPECHREVSEKPGTVSYGCDVEGCGKIRFCCPYCIHKHLKKHIDHQAERIEQLEGIVERIMTQHWDMAACQCWVCKAGREVGCHAVDIYHSCHDPDYKNYGRVVVDQALKHD